MSFYEYTLRRRLAERQYELALAEIDLEEHMRFYTAKDKDVHIQLFRAKVSLAEYYVKEVQEKIAMCRSS